MSDFNFFFENKKGEFLL